MRVPSPLCSTAALVSNKEMEQRNMKNAANPEHLGKYLIHHRVEGSTALIQTLRFDKGVPGYVQKVCLTGSGRYEITRARIIFTMDLLR